MGIMTRFMRLLKADLHGVMDLMEDKKLVLKQCLREMEEDIFKSDANLKNNAALLLNAEKDYGKSLEKLEKLKTDINAAIKKEKDDIAKFLIKRRRVAAAHVKELKEHIETLGIEIEKMTEILEKKRLSFEKLKVEAHERIRLAKLKKNQPSAHNFISPVIMNNEDNEVELELEQLKEALAAQG